MSNAASSSLPSHEGDTRQRIEAELEHEYRFREGKKIGDRYTVIEALGFGGFAEVYHCRDERLGRQVAVKVLTEEKGELQAEAKVAAKLDHPNIVPVYEFAELSDKTPLIIYKFIAGQTLEEKLNDADYRRLTLDDDTLQTIRQVGAALDHAHRYQGPDGTGIIHRDIKPSNVLIDQKGQAYLTDFGLASIKEAEEGISMLSVRQALSGTVPYMAPEQLLEKTKGTKSSDIYSLGVVVYEMLTGRLPFQGRDTRLIMDIASEEVTPTPPTVANAELPPALDDVLLRTLSHDPEKRYRSAATFVEELKNVTTDFAQANTQYREAMMLIKQDKWREAQTIFNSLPHNFKDVKLRRESVNQRIRLLDLYEKAKKQVNRGQFAKALNTLDSLKQVDPEYDIESLRQRALDGKAAAERRTLEEQYAEAVAHFESGEYQAVLNTLDVIAQKRDDYPDPQNIRAQAQEKVDYQNQLRQLYNQGVAQSRDEAWTDALETFKELSQKEPGYEDVAMRLAMAKHFSELTALLHQAEEKESEGEFAAAIDLVDRIGDKNADYKTQELVAFRQQLVESLFRRCQGLLEEEAFEACLACVKELKQRAPEHTGGEEVEAAAQEGKVIRDKRAMLREKYEEGITKLEERNFVGALTIWDEIQREKGDLSFSDTQALVSRAKEGIYNESIAALAEEPKRALELWRKLQEFDPEYPDSQNVVRRARKQIELQERRRKALLWVAGGIAVLLLLFFGGRAVFGGGDATPTAVIDEGATETAVALAALSTNTPTATATATATTSPTLTPTATRESTPTPTVTPDPTDTPRPTATPRTIAIAQQSASIFAEQDSGSEILAFIDIDESVTVLEQSSSWIRVRNDDEVEGWAATDRFDISGEEALATPTETATVTPTPATPTDEIAVVAESASIFTGPDTTYDEITFLNPGDSVEVQGRSANESWLFIRNDAGVEGWVALSLLNYDGDVPALPVVDNDNGIPPTQNGEIAGLTFDIWPLPELGYCQGGNWYQPIFMEGHGADGSYTYYINGQQVAGPTGGSFTYELEGSSDATVQITGRVTSGDGQTRETIIFVDPPTCGG